MMCARGGGGEGGEPLLESLVVGLELVQLGEDRVSLRLLLEPQLRDPEAVGAEPLDRRPEVLLFRRLVLRLLDDHLIDGALAERQLLGGGPGARLGSFFELGQHGLYLVVVLPQDLEHIRHLSLPGSDLLNLAGRDPATRVPWRQTARPPIAAHRAAAGARQRGDPVGTRGIACPPRGRARSAGRKCGSAPAAGSFAGGRRTGFLAAGE
jgi:hypothetical protein